MVRFTLVVVFLALLVPGLAAAKEPSKASISGPGFSKTLRGAAGFSGSPLGELTDASGFFPSAVGQSPDPMLHARPGGLGLRYTVVWLVPIPGATHRVRQDVYPYARGGAVAYMRPGQPIYDTTTSGGWYRGGAALKQTLVRLGLPSRAPSTSGGANLALLAGIGIPGALGLAGAAELVRRRRRAER